MADINHNDILNDIEELAAKLTPPSQMAATLGVNEDGLKLALSRHGSPERTAFMRGMAATASKIRENNISLANAGSPDAIHSCFASMREMLNDLSD